MVDTANVKPVFLEDCEFDVRDVKTGVAGQETQLQPSCRDRQCSLENDLVNVSEIWDSYTPVVASTTLPKETSESKLGSQCALVEPDLTEACTDAEVGNDSDPKEWNCPARLRVTNHEKKKE